MGLNPGYLLKYFLLYIGMSDIEYQSMFALWCLIKAPLMLGTDLTQMSMESETYKIISNERLIAINQDPLGKEICFDIYINGITK